MKTLFSPQDWSGWAAGLFCVALLNLLMVLAFAAWDAQF